MSTIIRIKLHFKPQCFEDEVIKQLGIDMGELVSMLGKNALRDLVSNLEEASFEGKGAKENSNAKHTKTASTYKEMMQVSIKKRAAKLKLESMRTKKSKRRKR